MKKQYQIDRERAVHKFRSAASASSDSIQLALPLKEAAALVQKGLMQLALATFTQVAEQLMSWDADQIVGPRYKANAGREVVRWGSQKGYCVVAGQKVPLQRPRVRDMRQHEVPLGSYESLQRASLMEEAVWNKMMQGLTTRRYSAIVRELKEAYGIEKSTVSEHFIEASRGRLEQLESRPLDRHQFCALLLDGICFDKQQVIVALGLTLQGEKMILGLRQGATENATVVKHLLEDLQQRGLDFEVPRLYVLDGSKALHAAAHKMAGPCAVVQRCQVHKIRNVVEYLPDEYRIWIRAKMRNAYRMRDYADAKRALDSLLHQLMHLNPSAARSLEEGMEETLTVHRLRVPGHLRGSLASTNLIESAFSIVATVCRNVKRWYGGDQHLRWIASALLWAESRGRRLYGYRELPILVKELELAVVRTIPVRHASAS